MKAATAALPADGRRAEAVSADDRLLGDFARTGNPNGGSLPPRPRYDTDRERTLILDESNGVVTRYRAQECAFMHSLPLIFP